MIKGSIEVRQRVGNNSLQPMGPVALYGIDDKGVEFGIVYSNTKQLQNVLARLSRQVLGLKGTSVIRPGVDFPN